MIPFFLLNSGLCFSFRRCIDEKASVDEMFDRDREEKSRPTGGA